MTWGEETLQMLAPLVARMLTVSTELPQETQLLAPPPPLETLQAPTWPAVPSRPSALEVAEGLDVALALQAAAAVDDEDQRERICVVCMDAPVDARCTLLEYLLPLRPGRNLLGGKRFETHT